MNSKEALEKLGNVEVAVTTIKSGITHFRILKEQYETEFEVLEKELFIIRDIKPFNVHQKQLEQLEKTVEHYEAIIKRWQEKYAFVEKELLQTKKNFKNSQVHSKNCYKKLKEKYTRLERAYKNNEVMTRDLNELINRNLELKNELKICQETISAWMENHKKLIIDNGKMKKAIEILKLVIELPMENDIDYVDSKGKNLYKLRIKRLLGEEAYELLKEVFESVGGKCE